MTGFSATGGVTGYLAAGDPQAGPIGLALVVVLGIAIAFLGRSMTRHLSRVPKSFDKTESFDKPDESASAETTVDPAHRTAVAPGEKPDPGSR